MTKYLTYKPILFGVMSNVSSSTTVRPYPLDAWERDEIRKPSLPSSIHSDAHENGPNENQTLHLHWNDRQTNHPTKFL